MIGDIIKLGSTIIDKVFPNKEAAQQAKLKLVELEQAGELKELDGAYRAIVAEANSADKWTSRARPSFLYVIYVMILAALPMGILHAFNPHLASSIATGMKEWLAAIPRDLWWLFGAGYLGYSASRSFDKSKIAKIKEKLF